MRADAARHPALQAGPLLVLTLALTLALTLMLQTPPALAQGSTAAAPETRDMIEALKPSRNRNLLVRQTPSAAAAAASSPGTTAAAQPGAAPTSAPVTATAPPAAQPLPPAATSTAANTTPVTVTTPAVPQAPTTSTPPPPAPSKPPVLVSAPTPAPPRPVSPAPAAGSVAAEPPPSLSLAIQFELNSSRVRPESGPVLGNLVAAMTSADLKGHRFVIEGHTDARGNPATNQLLSQQRADEVRLYLVALGVHPSRLRAVGKGSSELVNARDPMSADNRRVRVVTLE